MKKIALLVLALCVLGVSNVVIASGETDVMNLPQLTSYVTDFAGVVDENTISELNTKAASYEDEQGPQIVTVLFPHRQGNELFDIALNIFNTNGIGSKDENDGLLLLIATEEKKIRIMVGYGLESKMPDVLASDIIENDIRPLVNQGDFAGAIRAFYERATVAITNDEAAQFVEENSFESINIIHVWINILLAIFVLVVDVWYAKKMKKLTKKEEENKEHGITQKIEKPAPRPVIFLFFFQTMFIIGMGISIWGIYIGYYLLGPVMAARIGIIVTAGMTDTGSGSHGGSSSSSSGGRSSSSSSSSSSFSGGGGSSGGGGAGD